MTLKTPAAISAHFDERDVLLTRAEAAEYLRKSEPTLERWSAQGIGPSPIRCGPRSIRYRLSDLRAFTGVSQAA
jgi:predicted DNA-binding transcriptional regulator AlpA